MARKENAYIITYTSKYTNKKLVYDKIFYNKKEAKRIIKWMLEEQYMYKNPRIKKVI